MVHSFVAATLILRGLAPAQLGCPATSPAHSTQVIHAYVIRRAASGSSLPTTPGAGWSINFSGVPADTYSVRLWASNAAGDGCDTVVVRRAETVTGVEPLPRYRIAWYDLQGRRVTPPFDHHAPRFPRIERIPWP